MRRGNAAGSSRRLAVGSKGEIFVQFWLRPGEQPVVFELVNEPLMDLISVYLKHFL